MVMEHIFLSVCVLFANLAFIASELIATVHVVEAKGP